MTVDPQKMLDVSNILYAVAAFLTLFATFGVIYYGRLASSLKEAQLTQYQKDADVEIAEAKSQASVAIATAGQAGAKVAEANQKAGEANEKAAAATAVAEQSKLDKAKIESDNLRLQQLVEQERTARQALERGLADRQVLAASQQAAMAELSKLPPQTISFVTYAGNAEAFHVVDQMIYVFQQLKWPVAFATPIMGSSKDIEIIYDPHDAEGTSVAQIIARMLGTSHLPFKLLNTGPMTSTMLGPAYSGSFSGGPVVVIVGSK